MTANLATDYWIVQQAIASPSAHHDYMDEHLLQRIGKRVKKHRDHLKLNQEDYGKPVNISQRTISNIERGVGHLPDLSTCLSLAERLETTLYDLLELLPPDAIQVLEAYENSPQNRKDAIRELLGENDKIHGTEIPSGDPEKQVQFNPTIERAQLAWRERDALLVRRGRKADPRQRDLIDPDPE